MSMRLRLGLALVGALAAPVGAEPLDCPALASAVAGLTGMTAPPVRASEYWCILDGARSGGGGLRVTVDQLRVRGKVVQGRTTGLQVVARGLRAKPALDDREMPDWLRDMLRLQTAEVHLNLRHDEASDRVLVHYGHVLLSGGMEAGLGAEIAGADLLRGGLIQGRVTRLYLDLQYDGRTLRPAMEAIGEQLEPGATGTKAVLATRKFSSGIVAGLPERSFQADSLKALEAFIRGMPQHRGRLSLKIRSEDGIGAVGLGLLAIADDPTSPEALARFFAGTQVSVTWEPRFQR